MIRSASRAARVAVSSALTLCGCVVVLSGCDSLPLAARKPGLVVGDRYEAPRPKTEPAKAPDLAEVARINLRLASAYFAAGQYQTAREVIQVPLVALPNDHQVLGLAALIEAEMGQPAKARTLFESAFRIAPKDADLNHNYGVFLCRQGDPARALDYLRIALQTEGYAKPANSLAVGGDCLVTLGRDEEAIQFYTGALRFEPGNATALLGLADLYYRRGQLREAQEFSTRLARVSAATAQSLWLQLRIARRLGQAHDERQLAADLRRVFPQSSQTQLLDAAKYD